MVVGAVAALTGGCSLTDLDYLATAVTSDAGDGIGVRDAPDAAVEPPNLLPSADFEESYLGWYSFDFAAIDVASDVRRSGSQSLVATERARGTSGVSVRIRHLVEPGVLYRFDGWFRSDAETQPLFAQWKLTCFGDEGESFEEFGGSVLGNQWREFGFDIVGPTCDMDELLLIFSGPSPGVDFHLDDATLVVVE